MHALEDVPTGYQRLPFYYGWVNVAMAVLAMIGTLPGRTWGLGLITEPLLDDLSIERNSYADLNFWATIFGAAFCLPAGPLIDRFGCRGVLAFVSLGLGAAVVAMSQLPDSKWLFPLVLLTRGFGQSALSLASLALIGKWFQRRVSLAMTIWAVTMIPGFAVAERTLGYAVQAYGWRAAWSATGWILIAGLTPLALLLVRSTPERHGLVVDGDEPGNNAADTVDERSLSLTLSQALLTPAFWVLVLALSINSLTQSGIGLFGVSLVRELKLADDVFVQMMVIATIAALPGNLLTGWLAKRWSLRVLAAIGMGLLALSLPLLPRVQGTGGIYAFSSIWGLACGIVSVAMNAIWCGTFGREHLGKIQGAVAVCHVLSSASGPKIMVWSQLQTGQYGAFFYVSAVLAAALTLAVMLVPFPRLACAAETAESDERGAAALAADGG